MADRLQLVDELGAAEQLGHRAEREAAEVLVEAARDDAEPRSTRPSRMSTISRREELNLVDADDVVAVDEAGDVGGVVDRDRPHLGAGVADDVADVVAVVEPRLDDQRALAGDLGAPQPADELLALAAEHRPANDLEPAAAWGSSRITGGTLVSGLDGLLRVLELVLGKAPKADDAGQAAVLRHRQVTEVLLEHHLRSVADGVRGSIVSMLSVIHGDSSLGARARARPRGGCRAR